MCRFCRSFPRAPVDVVGGGSSTGREAWSAPAGVGAPGRRTLIRNGSVLSVDPSVGDFAQGDVLIEGSRILQIALRIDAPDAIEIDATGHIVMPGFIDTHHHQFETALRSLLADAILINDGRPESVARSHTIARPMSNAR
jgi:5-methylthioadenosine/S-adenosylhomocysteine deaminase